jgi:hypothetical protein
MLAIELDDRVTRRGYQRKTNRLPRPHISKEFPGKIDTSTPYVSGRSFRVWRWTAGGRWRVRSALLLLSAMR